MNTSVVRRSRGFTLIELIAVIVVLAILSAVAIPRYIDYTARARESAVRGTLGGVRSAIANFYALQAVNGSARFPTHTEMTTLGTVMQEAIMANPYQTNTATAATIRDANNTWTATPPISGNQGWAYDATNGRFWCNTTTTSINEHLW